MLIFLQGLMYLLRLGAGAEYQNIMGGELQSCSHNGMALTGFTRTGYCVDQVDDEG